MSVSINVMNVISRVEKYHLTIKNVKIKQKNNLSLQFHITSPNHVMLKGCDDSIFYIFTLVQT